MSKGKVKNGKLELYRFIACMCVLLFHALKYTLGEPSFKNGIHLDWFPHGAMGVEFFFVLTGFFMVASAYKKIQMGAPSDDQALSLEYVRFIKGKYLRIFPQHVIAFVITFIAYVITRKLGIKSIIMAGIKSLPNFFLIQMSGMNWMAPNHVEWYISCMLISLAVLYPVTRRFYYRFTRFFAPLMCLLICGYLFYTTKSLGGVSTWTGLTYKSMLRALAEIAIGTTTFEISREITLYWESHPSEKLRLFLSVLEYGALAAFIGFCISTADRRFEYYMIPCVMLMIGIGYCNITYGSSLLNNRFIAFLGELSLPVYLCQLAAVYLVQHFVGKDFKAYWMIVILSFIFAFITMALEKVLFKRKH